jgi:3-oxoacyl-[acyl-carrier protein] reductase
MSQPLLKDKVAVITGASRGIGRAIAHAYAEAGAKIIIAARSVDALESLRDEIKQKGFTDPILMKVDITKEDELQQLIDKALDNYNGLDILVNNAGVTRDGLLVRMSERDWDDVVGTNLKGTFFGTKAAAKIMMRQRRGRIINISSVVALVGNAGQANYAASKAGVIALTKSAAKELASRNVLVNAIAPGFIETDMTKMLPEAIKGEAKKAIPMRRFGLADEVAKTALYLGSDLSNYVTGQVITIDGGMVMA